MSFALSLFAVVLTAFLCYLFGRAAKEWRQESADLQAEHRRLWERINELRQEAERSRKHAGRLEVVLQMHQQASGGFWTTGLGTKLRIRDMTDCHLRNAIAWCEQNLQDTTDLKAELKLRRRNKRMEAQI